MKLGDFCQTNENSRLRGYGGLSGVTEPTVRILALRRTNLLPTVSHLSTGWEKCPRKSRSPSICGSERNASRSVTRSPARRNNDSVRTDSGVGTPSLLPPKRHHQNQ